MNGPEGVIAPTLRAVLTVTLPEDEVTVFEAPSVTRSSNCQAPAVVDPVVANDADPGEVQEAALPKSLKEPAPGASASHWQV
jgi:hypothetical protein